MKAPDHTKVVETTTSKYWFEGDLLYVVSKKAPQPGMETLIKETEAFKKNMNGKLVCAIIDVTNASPSSKETREYSTKQLPTIFKAIAFIIKNPLSRMLAHLYMGVKPLPFPVKMCSDEKEAHHWITQHL